MEIKKSELNYQEIYSKIDRTEEKFRFSKHSKLTNIYGLIDPREPNHIRYVGKADCLKKRANGHLKHAIVKKKDSNRYRFQDHRDKWVRKLFKSNINFEIVLIDCVQKVQWKFLELEYISLFRDAGHKLTNIAPGGNGGFISEEACKKIGKAQSRRYKKYGSQHKGVKRSEECCKRMSESRKKLNLKGEKNHMFGRTWRCINNGIENRRIKIDEPIPENWVFGELQPNNGRKGKKYKWINNGIDCLYIPFEQEIQEGWMIGNLHVKGEKHGMYGKVVTNERRKICSDKMKGRKFRKRTEQEKKIQSDKMKGRHEGKNNPMHGSEFIWINNGKNNRRFNSFEKVPEGYVIGYIFINKK